MTKTRRVTALIICLLFLTLACGGKTSKARTYDAEGFTFTIPAGWESMQEVWGDKAVSGQEYYGLGVQELVMIQYPPKQGKGNIFFAVASSPLEEGQTLESRFTEIYEDPLPEIRDESRQSLELGQYSGFEITYERPWGEPWWKFRDIWLEKDGMIYVLSFHCSEGSYETNNATFDQILESFQFTD